MEPKRIHKDEPKEVISFSHVPSEVVQEIFDYTEMDVEGNAKKMPLVSKRFNEIYKEREERFEKLYKKGAALYAFADLFLKHATIVLESDQFGDQSYDERPAHVSLYGPVVSIDPSYRGGTRTGEGVKSLFISEYKINNFEICQPTGTMRTKNGSIVTIPQNNLADIAEEDGRLTIYPTYEKYEQLANMVQYLGPSILGISYRGKERKVDGRDTVYYKKDYNNQVSFQGQTADLKKWCQKNAFVSVAIMCDFKGALNALENFAALPKNRRAAELRGKIYEKLKAGY